MEKARQRQVVVSRQGQCEQARQYQLVPWGPCWLCHPACHWRQPLLAASWQERQAATAAALLLTAQHVLTLPQETWSHGQQCWCRQRWACWALAHA